MLLMSTQNNFSINIIQKKSSHADSYQKQKADPEAGLSKCKWYAEYSYADHRSDKNGCGPKEFFTFQNLSQYDERRLLVGQKYPLLYNAFPW